MAMFHISHKPLFHISHRPVFLDLYVYCIALNHISHSQRVVVSACFTLITRRQSAQSGLSRELSVPSVNWGF